MGAPAASPATERLIHALDVSTIDEARAHVARLAGVVTRFKLGLELFIGGGPKAIDALIADGARIFLDLKLHDIPETVRRASKVAAASGAELITVHAAGGLEMLEAAVSGATEGGGEHAQVLAVTVLTSLDRAALAGVGTFTPTVEELVVLRALLAQEAGCDGVVASPAEARIIRDAVKPGFLIVTPGVRSAGAAVSDQKRTGSARQAIADGADAVVVGRPIRDAVDPVAAARAILAEMA